MRDDKDETTGTEGYVIQQSEFQDPGTDDDSGDGFIGEASNDEMLGLAMPDDLAAFEREGLANSSSREDLVEKLRAIRDRRRDILDDRRKGMGIDNAENYLRNL